MLAVTGVTFLALVAFEIGSRAFLVVAPPLTQPGTGETAPRHTRMLVYADASYDVDLLDREERELRDEMYRPYVVWSRKPFDGELIHIDAEGHRTTYHNSTRDDALQIWLLGGSVLWGQGVPDTETIPSFLAEIMNEQLGIDTRVWNLGEIGYVSTQEIVELIRQLQIRRRPDFVIFLDGVNDAPAAALWPDVPGTHMSYYKIRDRFEMPARRGVHPWLAVFRSSGFVRLADYLRQKLGLSGLRPSPLWSLPTNAAQISERGEQAARVWLKNYHLTDALGQSYDFVPLYFLQPSLFVGEKPLHPAEQELRVSESENEAKKVSMDVYDVMRRAVRDSLAASPSLEGVYDISDLFAQTREPLYVDYVHMAGKGNKMLAAELARILADRLCRGLPAGVSAHSRAQLQAFCKRDR